MNPTNDNFEKKIVISGPTICIHGPNACGKSAIVEILLEFFPGYTHFSTGDYAKKMATEAGMSINEYIVYSRDNNIPYDDILDNKLKEIGKSNQPWIVDSRLGYLFIPGAFNVYINIDTDIAAERRYEQIIKKDPRKKYTLSLEMTKEELIRRADNDHAAYLNKYATDIRLPGNYHFITHNNAAYKQALVASGIITEYYEWQKVAAPLKSSKA